MFFVYYVFVLMFVTIGLVKGNDALFFVAIGFAIAGSLDMLVNTVSLRIKKKNEYDEWVAKFNEDQINKMKKW